MDTTFKTGGHMTVTVLIKRKIPPEKENQLKDLYVEFKSFALHQEGYIGAEIKFDVYEY